MSKFSDEMMETKENSYIIIIIVVIIYLGEQEQQFPRLKLALEIILEPFSPWKMLQLLITSTSLPAHVLIDDGIVPGRKSVAQVLIKGTSRIELQKETISFHLPQK